MNLSRDLLLRRLVFRRRASSLRLLRGLPFSLAECSPLPSSAACSSSLLQPTRSYSTAFSPSEFASSSSCSPDEGSTLIASGRRNDPRGIFAFRELQLKKIKHFGFDYDYTLASYTRETEFMIYNLAIDNLIRNQGYPEFLRGLTYDPSFPIRGLHYDLKKGHIMKLDQMNSIQPDAIFFGRRPLTQREVLDHYDSFQLKKSYVRTECRQMLDIFCLPETSMLADVIQEFVDRDIVFDPQNVFSDVSMAVDQVHRTEALHATIQQDVKRYLRRQSGMTSFLTKLREHGKTTFLLTNSRLPFVDAGMRYLTEDYLPDGVSDWKELFDVIVVGCQKPSFFVHSRPFRKVDLPTGRLNWQRVTELKPGHVYSQGSLEKLTQMLGWKGDEVLYFGDHVIADLKESSGMGAWKTAVIIRELENEIEQQNTSRFRKDLCELLALEEKLAAHDPVNLLMDPQTRTNLYHRRNRLRVALKTRFNPYFGSVFRTHKEPTMFANLMHQFAYMYTSRLENLATLPLDYWLHAKRTYLPHEAKMSVIDESQCAGDEDEHGGPISLKTINTL
mmetsp:Transcript_46011/g.115829  ORF Transcript_46011/g.115829 Transcript_46011/m.115829 type:complete len:559 (-) Transcript_46011:65-1741(-)